MPFERGGLCATVITVGFMTGCAGSGEGLDPNGQPIGAASGSSSGGGAVTADFQSIQDNVFTPVCSKCHIGASAPEGLQLDAAHSYNLLVGVPSVEDSRLMRVDPGNPDQSYMVLKIEGASGIVGSQMPLGETPLPQATVDAIRQWVADGAANAPRASLAQSIELAATRSFGVESTAPVDHAVVSAPFRQIVVAFTHDLDASLVNGSTVMLERLPPRSNASAAADTANVANAQAVAMTAVLAEHNQAVLLATPRTPLMEGDYRLRLRGTGAAALADADAAALGLDVELRFTVEVTQ